MDLHRIPAAAAALILTAAAASSASAQAQASAPSAASPNPAEPSKLPITAGGVVGDLYVPAGLRGRSPAILVLGGSEGGLAGSSPEARDLARHGYVALALAYFGAPGVPDQPTNIPLEYFTGAVAFLKGRPEVDARRIGLMGTSKGGEAALLVATRSRDIKVVVAGVPSSVAWQGYDRKNPLDRSGSWTEAGAPVPFVPYDMSVPFTSVFNLYKRSLAHVGEHADAEIPVEKINGPVLLACGEADTLWPSCPMSAAVETRLKNHGFGHRVDKLSYANAGHAAFGPPVPVGNPARASLLALGGDEAGNVSARADSWRKAIQFLDEALTVRGSAAPR